MPRRNWAAEAGRRRPARRLDWSWLSAELHRKQDTEDPGAGRKSTKAAGA